MAKIQPRAKVIEHAAVAFGLTFDDLVGKARHRSIVHARFAAIYVIRKRWPDFSRVRIGVLLGGRDHSTICHAITEATRLYERDMRFRAICDQLEADREPFGPVYHFKAARLVEAPCELVVAKVRQQADDDDAAATQLERNWTAALANIRRGSMDLLRAIAAAHPERLAA
jgi:hypothetical protein